MRLFEEADAARDREGNVPAREFELQFQRVKVRAIQHDHLVQRLPFLAQLQHALRDERRLLTAIVAGHENRFKAGPTGGRELLGELFDIRRDGRVGHVENLRRAAVVRLDLVNDRAGMPLRKVDDVAKVRAAPRVDALRIVTHDHDVAAARREQLDQVALDLVGVLVFIDQYELELALVMLADIGRFLHQLEPEREQVVEVHRVGGALAFHI